MNGRFGVFDGKAQVGGDFCDDHSADEYRRSLLQEHLPEHLRQSLYDAHSLEVREIADEVSDAAA